MDNIVSKLYQHYVCSGIRPTFVKKSHLPPFFFHIFFSFAYFFLSCIFFSDKFFNLFCFTVYFEAESPCHDLSFALGQAAIGVTKATDRKFSIKVSINTV